MLVLEASKPAATDFNFIQAIADGVEVGVWEIAVGAKSQLYRCLTDPLLVWAFLFFR
jgi:hypothetical protein